MNTPPKFMVPWQPIEKHGERLPHWQQDEAIQFVTFRLADSMPQDLLRNWKAERQQWLKLNPPPWNEAKALEYHHRFTSRFDRWLDHGHGECLLRIPDNRAILRDVLMAAQPKKALHHAWVIMPNHVHLLFTPKVPVSKLIQVWKGVSARRIGQAGLWQANYYDRMIRDQEHFVAVLRYIRRNTEGVPSGHYCLWESDEVKRLGLNVGA